MTLKPMQSFGEAVLNVVAVSADEHADGIVMKLHLDRQDGSLLTVAIDLEDLLVVAGNARRKLCELAGVAVGDLDDSRPRDLRVPS